MSGHRHNPNASTQNQGNALGDRPSVRQSRLYRTHESGNSMKGLLGVSHLSWDSDHQQGAYNGRPVYDHDQVNSAPGRGGGGGGGGGAAYERHRAMEQDSYSNSTYQTTASGYGVAGGKGSQPQAKSMAPRGGGYDENYQNNAEAPRRRSMGPANGSSGVAGSLRDDSEYVPPKPRGNNYSNQSSGMAGSMNGGGSGSAGGDARRDYDRGGYERGPSGGSGYDRAGPSGGGYERGGGAYDSAPSGYSSMKNQMQADSGYRRSGADDYAVAAPGGGRRSGAQDRDTRLW